MNARLKIIDTLACQATMIVAKERNDISPRVSFWVSYLNR